MADKSNKNEKKSTKVVEGKKVEKKDKSKGLSKGTGLDTNLVRMFCYLLGPVSGIIFLATEKDTKHWKDVEKDVYQGLVLTVSIYLGLFILGFFHPCIIVLFWLAALAYIIYVSMLAYQGEEVEIPIVTEVVKDSILK